MIQSSNSAHWQAIRGHDEADPGNLEPSLVEHGGKDEADRRRQ
jgi:hypothetical protein